MRAQGVHEGPRFAEGLAVPEIEVDADLGGPGAGHVDFDFAHELGAAAVVPVVIEFDVGPEGGGVDGCGPPAPGDEGEGGDEVDVFVCAELEDAAEDLRGDHVDEGIGGEDVHALEAEACELFFERVDLLVDLDEFREGRARVTAGKGAREGVLLLEMDKKA